MRIMDTTHSSVVMCMVALMSLLAVTSAQNNILYMDSEDSCGYRTTLEEEGQYKLQSHRDFNLENNETGYYPCLQKYYSNGDSVCISQIITFFFKCTVRLNMYMFDHSSEAVSDIVSQKPAKVLDCNNPMTDEWCTPRETNVLLQLESISPNVSLADFYFMLEIAKLESKAKFTFMFSNEAACDTNYYLHHSEIYISQLNSNLTSCTKTFKYYKIEHMAHSSLCLGFTRWSKTFTCSSYEIQVYNMIGTRFNLVQTYKCSNTNPEPAPLCIDGPAMRIKMIKHGEMTQRDKDTFRLVVWDKLDKQSPEEQNTDSMSAGTIALIVFGTIAGVVFLVGLCCLCRGGGCKGGGRGGAGGGFHMPSLDFDGDD